MYTFLPIFSNIALYHILTLLPNLNHPPTKHIKPPIILFITGAVLSLIKYLQSLIAKVTVKMTPTKQAINNDSIANF